MASPATQNFLIHNFLCSHLKIRVAKIKKLSMMKFNMKLKKIGKKIINMPFVARIIGSAAYWYVRFVAATTRWEIRNLCIFYDNLEKYDSVIYITWHGRVAMAPYFWDKRKSLKALVSPHRDGQMIVKILNRFGIGNIDGSSNRHAQSAAVTLMHELKRGTTIAIIPDGPRGPSMTMRLSPLYFAQKTGKPVIGVTYSMKHALIVQRSWDRMLIPLPFQKGICAATEPFFVPENATKEELEIYRQKIENALNELTWGLDRELGLPLIPQGTLPRKTRKK